jgi:hypothetical protein
MGKFTSIGVDIKQLRSEIAQLEARYDNVFPPGVYAVIESLRRELAALHMERSETEVG